MLSFLENYIKTLKKKKCQRRRSCLKMDLFKANDLSKGIENIDKLFELHSKFVNENRENTEKIKKLEEENDELQQRMTILAETHSAIRNECLSLEKKIENLSKCCKQTDVSKCFETQADLLGYFLKEFYWDEKLGVLFVKFHFDYTEYYVQFGISEPGLTDVIDIVPQHPNFECIQEHFRHTQDSTSLLMNLRKYFSTMTNAGGQTYN